MRLVIAAVVLFLAGAVQAAELRVMISAGFYNVYAELGPAFEKATGHKLVTSRGPSVGDSPEAIPGRLGRGEEADVVICDGRGSDDLVKRGFIRQETWTQFAKSKVGMVMAPEAAPVIAKAGLSPVSAR